jgi:hypothetical protein
MTQQMKVKVKFDNWLNLDSATKSLVNFFMSDAGLYMYGDYQVLPALKASFRYSHSVSDHAAASVFYCTAATAGANGNNLSVSVYKDVANNNVVINVFNSGTSVCLCHVPFQQDDSTVSEDTISDAVNELDQNTLCGDFVSFSSGILLEYISSDSSNPITGQLSGGRDRVDGITSLKACVFPNHRVLTFSYPDYYSEYKTVWIPYTNEIIPEEQDIVVSNDYTVPDVNSILTRASTGLYFCDYTHVDDSSGSGSGSGGGSGSGNSTNNTALLNSMTLTNSSAEYNYTVKATSLNTNVTIIPYIDGVVNTNSSMMPTQITSSNHLISAEFENSDDINRKIDFQLRTSSFKLVDYDHGVHENMYIKIGIYPFENENIDDVKSALITDVEHNDGQRLFIGASNRDFDMIPFEFMRMDKVSDITFFREDTFDNGGTHEFPTKAIFPFRYTDMLPFSALIYMQLCNEDGAPYTNEYGDEFGELDSMQVSTDGENWQMPRYFDGRAQLDICELTPENENMFIPVTEI